jgi:hypothetical protein
MECPHCNNEIPGKTCSDCGGITPAGGRFCMNCGAEFEPENGHGTDEDNGFDLDDRVLCSDGTCTGIIVDGKCSECGKPPQEDE